MPLSLSPEARAVWQALFVTFLWSTSWVLIKFGLADIPPLTFAGLRYTLAFCCLLPWLFQGERRVALRALPRQRWLQLGALGLLHYTLAQGAQFVGLAFLPTMTVSLLLNFTALIVTLLGIWLLRERPGSWQWLGVALTLGGALLYFYPVFIPAGEWVGLMAVAVCVFSNAGAAVLGRSVARRGDLPPLLVTLVTMGVGSLVLLGAGLLTQGLPALSWKSWAIIAWLGVVNTAFAFTLWNHTLRQLSAVQSSIINSSMMVQIAVLALLFLGETLNQQELGGIALSVVGVLMVQVRR